MIELYAEKRIVTIIVMRGNKPDLVSFKDINVYQAQVPISEIGVPIVYEINDDGVLFPSQGSEANHFEAPMQQPYDSQADYLITQESCNLHIGKGKEIVEEQSLNEQHPMNQEIENLNRFLEEFDDHVEQPMEQEDDYKFVDSDSSSELDDPELNLKISQSKRKRADPKFHMEVIQIQKIYFVMMTVQMMRLVMKMNQY